MPESSNSPDIAHILTDAKVQRVPSDKVQLFIRRDFLGAAACADLIEMIDAERRPSTITDFNGDAYFRTSETCDLDHENPLVAALDAQICLFAGIDRLFGERLQGQRYAVGQEFKAHTDYFEPGGADFEPHTKLAGQRTWTFMIYLNDTQAGGATRFKVLNKNVQPEPGKLLFWNNQRPDGRPNPNTLHHGMKVRAGTKYVITKWFRERHWGWQN